MSDDEFPKAIMMHILRAKIALDFHQTEERNFGLEHEYSPTLNRKNEAMAGVDEIDCEPTDNLAVNDHMYLGETRFFKLSNGGPDIDWSIGYDINHKVIFLQNYIRDPITQLMKTKEYLEGYQLSLYGLY